MKLGHWQKFQNLQIYPLSTSLGWNWAYFRSTGSGFQDTCRFSKLPYFIMKLGRWQKFQKLHIHSLFMPEGWLILGFFLLYAQQFLRYGPIFKNLPYLGMKLGYWLKLQKFTYTHVLPFYPRGLKLSIFTLRAAVSEIWANFQNCHIWAWNLDTGKSSEVAHIFTFHPMGSKLSLFSLYEQWYLRYGRIFKIAIFMHETYSHIDKSSRSSTYILSTPWVQNWAYFRSTGHGYQTWP